MSIGESFNSPLALLVLNSQRVGNLGKAACLILEVLMEKPRTRREIADRLGYSRNGANYSLKKLKEKGLVVSEEGLYSLTEDFYELLRVEIQNNDEDLQKLSKTHDSHREDHGMRMEAWKEAWDQAGKDYQKEVTKARESGGIQNWNVAYNKNTTLKALAQMAYIEIRHRQLGESENG